MQHKKLTENLALSERALTLLTQGISFQEEMLLKRELVAALEAKVGIMPGLLKLSTADLITLHSAVMCS